MATTNAFASRPRENQSRDTRLIDNNKPRIAYSGNNKGEYKQGVTGGKTVSNSVNSYNYKAAKTTGNFNQDFNNKKLNNQNFNNQNFNNKDFNNKDINNQDNKNQDFNYKDTNNRDLKNKDYKNKDYKNKDYKNKDYTNKSYPNKDYKNNIYDKDKDYDLDMKHGKGKSGDSKPKSSQSKDKEPQPDKLETMKRLEKEKKVLLKKNQEINDKEKSNKPIIKQRRTTNIDWTKGYEKGLFGDDDEDYTEYY